MIRNQGVEFPADNRFGRLNNRSLLCGNKGDGKGLVGLREGQVLEGMLQSGTGQLL